jgi:hypothetical protein
MGGENMSVPITIGLQPTPLTSSATAKIGQQINAIASAPLTVTLPTPVLGGTIGILATGATSSYSLVTVSASGGAQIYGLGLTATSLPLGTVGAKVILQSLDGTNWHVVVGQQDTGWLNTTPATGFTYGGSPQVRLLGDRVWFSGQLQNSAASGSPSSVAAGPLFTLPGAINLGLFGATVWHMSMLVYNETTGSALTNISCYFAGQTLTSMGTAFPGASGASTFAIFEGLSIPI